MYKSPIDIIYGQMQTQMEGDIFRAVQSYGINVDKEELLRALRYDRGQYDKGYADGEREAMDAMIRCKECRHCTPDKNIIGAYGYCGHFGCYAHEPMVEADDFCSYGERREDGI